MEVLLLVIPMVAGAGWERLFRRLCPDLLLRLLLASLCTLMQLSSGLAVLGFLGFLRPGVAVGLQLLISVALFFVARPGASTTPTTWTREPRGYIALNVVALLGLPILVRMIWYASVLEPYTMDGLAYHLPPLVEALQRGRFVVSETLNVWANAYPKNAEMISLWLMLGRHGSLILFTQLLFLPAGILGVALLARRSGTPARLSLAAGLSLFFLPIVVAQSTTEYIDIAMGCTLLACAALTLLYRDGVLTRPWGTVVLLAALGFLAGIKYNGPVVAVVFGAIAFWPDLVGRRLGREHLVGLLLAVPGAIWYFANIVWFHNPLWPFAIPGMHWLAPYTAHVQDIMRPNTPKGFLNQSPWLSTWQVWREQIPTEELYSIDSRYGGFGPLWFCLWLPAIPFWLFKTVREGRWRKSFGFALLFIALFAVMEAFWWPRYSWWFAALGIVAFAVLWHRMPPLLQGAAGLLTVLGALFVLHNTLVQPPWYWQPFAGVLEGKQPFSLLYGETYAQIRQRQGEVIALSQAPWQQYYLYGDDYSNRLVMVTAASAGELEAQMRAAGATLYFAAEPTDPVLGFLPECL